MVTARMVVHRGQDLQAVLGLEGRRLEREGGEENLPASSSPSFLFCCDKQPRPQPLLPPRLIDPELADFEAATPRVPTDPGNNSVFVVSH